MRRPGINGKGELRGQPANPGSPGKMAVKTECVSVCLCVYSLIDSFIDLLIDSLIHSLMMVVPASELHYASQCVCRYQSVGWLLGRSINGLID